MSCSLNATHQVAIQLFLSDLLVFLLYMSCFSLGHRCDLCIDGYYGEPTEPLGHRQCRKCECNENVDPNGIGNCDRLVDLVVLLVLYLFINCCWFMFLFL